MALDVSKFKVFKVNIKVATLIAEMRDQGFNESHNDAVIKFCNSRYKGQSVYFNTLMLNDELQISWGVQKNSQEIEILNKEALSLVKKKQFDQAIALWQRAAKENLLDPDFHYNLSLAFIEKKDYNLGIRKCLDAIKICPIYFKAYFVLGSIYSKMRKFDDAKKNIKQGLIFQSGNILALINLGAVYSIIKEHNNAISMFEKAISLSPKESKAYLGLGKIYASQNDFENANRYFKAVIKIDPASKLADIAKKSMVLSDNLSSEPSVKNDQQSKKDADRLYSKAYLAFISTDYKKSIEIYAEYLKIRSNDANAWSTLASCQMRLGKTSDALVSIQKGIRFNPNKAAYYKQAAILYDIDNNPFDAGKNALKAYELGNQDSVVLTLIGISRFHEKQFQESVRLLGEAVNLNANNLKARYHFAIVLKALGQRDAAKEQCEEILWSKNSSPLKEKARQEIQSIS